MKYRFLHAYPPYTKGDAVPDTYTTGMIQTMLDCRRIEAVPDAVPVEDKNLDHSPADKMLRPARVKRKGVA